MSNDLIKRSDAITAVRSVSPGTVCRSDAIIQAINAIPSVAVTDDMVERAAITHWNNDGFENERLAWDELDQHDRDFLIKGMKAALVAALGE